MHSEPNGIKALSALVLARHCVGIGLVLGLFDWNIHRASSLEDAAIRWTGMFLGVMLITLAGNGLLLLFFTRSARLHFGRNLVVTAWVLTALLLFGLWQPYLAKKGWLPTAQRPSETTSALLLPNAAQEGLANSVQTAQSAASSLTAPPVPVFTDVEARLSYLRWLGHMSTRQRLQHLDWQTRKEFLQTVWYESKRAGLDTSLVLAVVEGTSNFRQSYVSERGNRGYMAVSPQWSKKIGDGDTEKLFHMQTNLRFGCVILRHYLDRHSGNMQAALTDYFAANPPETRPSDAAALSMEIAKQWGYDGRLKN